MSGYVPDRGHIVWLNFTPQSGHEQAGKRPAFVVSPAIYNKKVGLALFCPVTSQKKGYPFEVLIPPGKTISGVILSDQLKSLDWNARKAKFIEKLPVSITEEVISKIATLIEP
jgi:mRNA interferase MazF